MRNLILAVMFLLSSRASAEMHPSRLRLLLHGSRKVTSRVALSGDVIIPNLAADHVPIAFLVLDIEETPGTVVSPVFGWNFASNEAIASLHIELHRGRFWSWMDVELQPQSWSVYWFVQFQCKLYDWLHVGVEEESWGTSGDGSTFSHGGGPNALFRLGKFGLDTALHVRDLNHVVAAEIFVRAHVFAF